MINAKRSSRAFLIFASLLTMTNCASFSKQQAWTTTSVSVSDSLAIEIAEPSGGVASLRIYGRTLEGAVLTGTAMPDNDGWVLAISGMDWFNNWSRGWTEARFGVEGELAIMLKSGSWTLTVIRPPRIEKPISASLRLNGNYFFGDEALVLFSNRWDRIVAVTETLRKRYPSFLSDSPHFEKMVRKFLFPELYGYEERPSLRHNSERAESISWDTDYTTLNFPQSLAQTRNSGAMLRDFEESPGLWRLAFCWTDLWETGVTAAAFRKMPQR